MAEGTCSGRRAPSIASAMARMKLTLVQAPIAIASLIAGTLVFVAVLALFTSSPRWDDHLINAVGVFVGGLFVSLVLWLATAAFRPQLGVPKRARLIRIVWLIALVLVIVLVIGVTIFINNFSFL